MKKMVLFLLMAAILMTALLSACSTAGQDASQQESDSETVADQGRTYTERNLADRFCTEDV